MRCYHYLKTPLIVANGTFLSSKGISQQFLTDYKKFKKLSELGKELGELHLHKHPSLGKNGVGFTESGSDIVEKVYYEENSERVWINKSRYFDGISKAVWEYRIGEYQVLDKYLKDRKKEKRKLSLAEMGHYMKVAKAIERTREVEGKGEDFSEM